MIISYMRPFYEDPECIFQMETVQAFRPERQVIEEHASSKRREALEHLIASLAPGDVVVVSQLYVLADSSRHLIELLEQIEQKQAYLVTIREQIDTREPLTHSFRELVEHLVALQSDVVSMTTRQGLTKAKADGKQTGRPRKADANVKRAIEMYQSKQYNLAEIRQETGISKSTLYRYLEQ
ncbi:recombinase family protein [Exiguobacterium oxidotolerans]|uniref:recombinase family protein n=1 Tax=Exiguobacterium oxidotolerans TaxID=223958 RepID=UPI000494258A|nr:recombinase family protein [Exiguobacterium oxidotolerans]